MLIPAESKITIHINDEVMDIFETYEEMDIQPDTLLAIGDCLISTDSIHPVEKVKEKEYKVFCWWQDSMAIKDGIVYKSANDID